jgi:hypothetical protein
VFKFRRCSLLMGEHAEFSVFYGETCCRKLFPTDSHLNFDALKIFLFFVSVLTTDTPYLVQCSSNLIFEESLMHSYNTLEYEETFTFSRPFEELFHKYIDV